MFVLEQGCRGRKTIHSHLPKSYHSVALIVDEIIFLKKCDFTWLGAFER